MNSVSKISGLYAEESLSQQRNHSQTKLIPIIKIKILGKNAKSSRKTEKKTNQIGRNKFLSSSLKDHHSQPSSIEPKIKKIKITKSKRSNSNSPIQLRQPRNKYSQKSTESIKDTEINKSLKKANSTGNIPDTRKIISKSRTGFFFFALNGTILLSLV